MKDHQFEEIVFWLSLIACLLAYHSGIGWLTKILAVISVMNCVSMIATAWKYVRSKSTKIYLIARIVKKWLCRHNWELVQRGCVRDDLDNILYEVEVYRCRKCGKVKTIRINN